QFIEKIIKLSRCFGEHRIFFTRLGGVRRDWHVKGTRALEGDFIQFCRGGVRSVWTQSDTAELLELIGKKEPRTKRMLFDPWSRAYVDQLKEVPGADSCRRKQRKNLRGRNNVQDCSDPALPYLFETELGREQV